MKAAVLHSNCDIRYEDYPEPVAERGCVLVGVKASGICGSDIPRVFNNMAHHYPIVLGHEFSGEIVEIGEGVTGFEVYDRVTGAPLLPCMNCDDCRRGFYSLCKNYSFIGSRIQGSFAELICLPAINAVKFDKSISYEQAAFFEPSTVALHGLRCCGFKGGGETAVIGGGTIGLFTMQWAGIFGAKSVTVFDISDERLELAKSLGADNVVNIQNQDCESRFDYVFETAGQTRAMISAFELAANKARICFIGTPHENLSFTPKQWENMNRKEFKLTGSWMSYSAPFPGEEWSLTAHYFNTGRLKFDERLIFKKFPLSEAASAFAMFEKPQNVKGKVLLYNT